MFSFKKEAIQTFERGVAQGIVSDSINEIIEIVLEQEIVSYCTNRGCVSFDVDDLLFEE